MELSRLVRELFELPVSPDNALTPIWFSAPLRLFSRLFAPLVLLLPNRLDNIEAVVSELPEVLPDKRLLNRLELLDVLEALPLGLSTLLILLRPDKVLSNGFVVLLESELELSSALL